MIKYLLFISFNIIIISTIAQNSFNKYQRSSLAMFLIETDDYPDKKSVLNSWKNYPFPDKYDNHNIGDFLNLNSAILIYKEIEEDNLFDEDKYLLDPAAKYFYIDDLFFFRKLEKTIYNNAISQNLLAKWFNFSDDWKTYSTQFELIQNRGHYNATESDAEIALKTARGLQTLKDKGTDLIKNTFVTFTILKFKDRKQKVSKTKTILKIAGELTNQKELTELSSNIVGNIFSEGYDLVATSLLFRLNWHDSVQNDFYANVLNDGKINNPIAFKNSRLYTLDYVGFQKDSSRVSLLFKNLFKEKSSRDLETIIDLNMTRAIDKVFVKLQKKYEIFKPYVPILSTNPITAEIGKKEGLEGGEKFEVLSLNINKKTGALEYKRVDVISVDKKKIWDNRYYAGLNPKKFEEERNLKFTTFNGGKSSIVPGMLLRQLK